MHYNIEISDESPVVTTREKSKAQEVVAAASPLPQSEEGREGAESDGEDSPMDDAEEGNNDAEESKGDDTEAEESDDKESAAEESGEQVEDSNPHTTLEARSKRWFVQGSRDVYYAGLALNDKGNPIRSIQKEPKIRINSLNEVPELKRLFEVRSIPVDISERTITRVLMGSDYTVSTRTTECGHRMETLKGIRKLSTKNKLMHFWWKDNIIVKDKEEVE
ncbi:hypothetical protein HAX54_021767 [Datura stramonium]|uniref:Uncharacterized protein n=1 Tax=Datura stramonium TaxID=4076 RepID=A0ABS8UV94_DATST|nr:hypothetical protein [Datura stramonium]